MRTKVNRQLSFFHSGGWMKIQIMNKKANDYRLILTNVRQNHYQLKGIALTEMKC